MIRTYEFALYPNHAQAARLSELLDGGRQAYNWALEHRIKAWKRRKQKVSYFDQQGILAKRRSGTIPSEIERDALRRVAFAFKKFYERASSAAPIGFPRFKPPGTTRSFRIAVKYPYHRGTSVHVTGVGRVRCRGGVPVQGVQSCLQIVKRAKRWVAQIIVDDGRETPPLREGNRKIGVDVGLKKFATFSDGSAVENPRHLKKALRKLKRAQRAVSRRKKGSLRRRKAVHRLRVAHERVRNCRKDFHHKLSRKLVDSYDRIAVEDLHVEEMKQGWLARSISDAGWSQFTFCLTYKAEEAGVSLVKVNARGTSQECSQCGETVPKTLATRVHRCPNCGLTMDRDENAARNILKRSLPPAGRESTPGETCRR